MPFAAADVAGDTAPAVVAEPHAEEAARGTGPRRHHERAERDARARARAREELASARVDLRGLRAHRGAHREEAEATDRDQGEHEQDRARRGVVQLGSDALHQRLRAARPSRKALSSSPIGTL